MHYTQIAMFCRLSLLASVMIFVISLVIMRTAPVSFQAEYHNFLYGNAKLEGKRGAVTSGVGICSKIGVDVIRKGGNAADAVSLR